MSAPETKEKENTNVESGTSTPSERPRKRRRQSNNNNNNSNSNNSSNEPEDRIDGPDTGNNGNSNNGQPHTAGSSSGGLIYRQPACQRCRSKKIRCDALSPQCTACKKAGEECTISNPTNHQEYHRGYVESLEDRIHQLQAYIGNLETVKLEDIDSDGGVANHIPDENVPAEKPSIARAQPTAPAGIARPSNHQLHKRAISNSSGNDTRFIGEGSGIGLINSVMSAIRSKQSDVTLLKSLLSADKRKQASKIVSTKSSFHYQNLTPQVPQTQLGMQLLNSYLELAHPRHPFISRAEVIRVCETVLGFGGAPLDALPAQDCFRAFMIFALGSVFHFKHGDPNKDMVNPMKYYAYAMSYIDGIPKLHNIDGITNLLLIARLGFFCATGLSLWYISNLCLRMCIENEMHLNPSRSKHSQPMKPFDEQMRRRLFWQCYSLDRHASSTLGRPFGIADDDIKVDLPADIDDDILIRASGDLPSVVAANNMVQLEGRGGPRPTSEIALFIYNIKLKMITSKMNMDFYQQSREAESHSEFAALTAPGKFYVLLDKYVTELTNWRAQAPTSPPAVQPTAYGFYTEDYLDLQFHQEKLALCRSLIDQIPSQHGYPPQDLLDMCFEAASQVLILYKRLWATGNIEPARSRLYRVFVAGVSALFCLLRTQQRLKESTGKLDEVQFKQQKDVLKICQETLEVMAKPLVDDGNGLKYVRTFEVLCREVVRRVQIEGPGGRHSHHSTKHRNGHHGGGSGGNGNGNGTGSGGGPAHGDQSLAPPGVLQQNSLHLRKHPSTIESQTVLDGEFGGASPPAGYERIHQQPPATHSGNSADGSPHSAQSWPPISDFAAGEIGEWFSGMDSVAGGGGANNVTGGGGATGAGAGAGGVGDALGGRQFANSVESGVTGGYDYDLDGLMPEWANFLEILLEGR